MIINEIGLHELQIENDTIELVVGEAYESIGSGQKGILISADIEKNVYEIALADDTNFRRECLARGIETNYIWKGGFGDLTREWVYIGPSIVGYDEIIAQGCCKDSCCSGDQACDLPARADFSEEVAEVVKLIDYGFGWLEDHPHNDPYRVHSIETLAHIIACFITQNITNEATPTNDIVEIISDLPTDEELTKRIFEYVTRK